MRKEIHHNAGGNPKLFAQQEDAGVLVKALTVDRNDQFIDTSLFQECPDFVAAKNAEKFQSPNVVSLDRPGELMRRLFMTHHSDMAYVENTVFPDFNQNDSIRNKKDVIDDQRGQNDDAIRGVRVHKGNQNRHDQPCETYRLRKPSDLIQRRQRRLGVNAKEGQQQSPSWKDDCNMPKVCLNGHDDVSAQVKQRTKEVSQKETRRYHSQISQPQVDGKNSFSLTDHAGSRR